MAEEYLKGRKILILFVCVLQMCISLGMVYGYSVMYAELVNVFSTSRTKAALIQGIFIFITIGGGILWTCLVDLFGIGLSVIIGSILASVGLIASSFSTDILMITICTGVISGTGLSVIFLSPFLTVNVTFREDPGFPLVLLTVGGSLGQMIMPLVYDVILTEFHWSGAMIILAGICLHCVPCGLVVMYSEEASKSSYRKESCSINNFCDKELLKNYVFCLFLFNVLILYIIGNFAFWFLVDQMISLGFSHQSATALLSVVGFSNLSARVISSIVKMYVKLSTNLYHYMYACPLLALAQALLLVLQTNSSWMIIACIVQGLGYGFVNGYLPLIAHELAGHDKYLQAIAQINLTIGTSNLLSNIVGGRIRDYYRNYDVMYEAGVGGALLVSLGIISSIFLSKTCKTDTLIESKNNGPGVKMYNSLD